MEQRKSHKNHSKRKNKQKQRSPQKEEYKNDTVVMREAINTITKKVLDINDALTHDRIAEEIHVVYQVKAGGTKAYTLVRKIQHVIPRIGETITMDGKCAKIKSVDYPITILHNSKEPATVIVTVGKFK